MAKSKAKIGDRISFQRKDLSIEGEVEIVRDNSVIVKVSDEAKQIFDYETPRTVVKHSNYVILEPSLTV
ncbi:hypothetical protein AM500_13505 [Bacillus sp. FJAT-18017]|jgi:uncharacterized protein YkvS|uniref:DUF2187 family protein n=1 Tax=unclassified Bacillus (in: firmicutes) TaxID=185979 RepID=UPI0005C6CB09|nr:MULTISPECIES: DUF2187 family protein [unclassified Bacillus (in: firmicutes)]ALC90687.1 hypothetical protein AM500_13505 [Bacillus sp. FJAT-18017]